MLAATFLLPALFPILATAYFDSLPVVAWSSHSSSLLDALPSTLTTSNNSLSIVQSIVSGDDICDHDAVIIIDQPGLHASDLRSLPPSSALAKRLADAPSSLQFAHTPSSISTIVPLQYIALSISIRCNSRFINSTPGRGHSSVAHNEKHVVHLIMDNGVGSSTPRKAHMSEQESHLADELDILTSIFPKHLVIYSASRPSSFFRRQLDSITAPNNGTLPEGGILKRYQLLTPALIMALLVVLFILIPVVLIGINALSSIQSPLRTESPRAFSARDKKNQ